MNIRPQINFQIEDGVPLPPERGSPQDVELIRALKATLSKMTPGQSFQVEVKDRSKITECARRLGLRVSTRTLQKSSTGNWTIFRVWLVGLLDEPRPNNGQKPEH